MAEIPKFNDLAKIYLSDISPTSAGNFFGAVTPDGVGVFCPYVIALDRKILFKYCRKYF
jgi:hypothetical protein